MAKKNYSDYIYVKTKSKDITREEQARAESKLTYDYKTKKLLIETEQPNTGQMQLGSFNRSTPRMNYPSPYGILEQIEMHDMNLSVDKNLLNQITHKKEEIRRMQEEVKSLEALLSSREGEVKKHSKRSDKSSIFKE